MILHDILQVFFSISQGHILSLPLLTHGGPLLMYSQLGYHKIPKESLKNGTSLAHI